MGLRIKSARTQAHIAHSKQERWKGGKVVKVKDAPRRGNEPTAQGRVECNETAPWDQRNDIQSC